MAPPARIDHANMSPRLNPKNLPISLAESCIAVVIVPGLIHLHLPVELECARGVFASVPAARRRSTMLVSSVTGSATECAVVPWPRDSPLIPFF